MSATLTTISTSVERIDSKKAAKLLELNTDNFRNMDKQRVAMYRNNMKNGTWRFNGDAIRIDINNVLLDGQHRLKAIVESDTEQEMIIIRGLEPECRLTIDRNKPRLVSDEVKNRGIKSATSVTAAVKKIIAHDKGHWAAQKNFNSIMTDQEVIDFTVANEERLLDAFNMTSGVPKQLCSRTVLTAVMFCGTPRDDLASNNAVANWFAEALKTGAGLTETDAVLHFKKRCFNAKIPLNAEVRRHLLTLAWNKTALDQPMRSLQIRFTGPNAKTPPKAIAVAEEGLLKE